MQRQTGLPAKGLKADRGKSVHQNWSIGIGVDAFDQAVRIMY